MKGGSHGTLRDSPKPGSPEVPDDGKMCQTRIVQGQHGPGKQPAPTLGFGGHAPRVGKDTSVLSCFPPSLLLRQTQGQAHMAWSHSSDYKTSNSSTFFPSTNPVGYSRLWLVEFF